MGKFPLLEHCKYFDFELASSHDTIKFYDNYMRPDVYKSRSVKKKSIDGSVGGGMPAGASAHINVQYEVQEDRGAICWLPDAGVLKEIESNKRFEQYIKENIDDWHRGIADERTINLEDLIVVKGTIKSPQYKTVAIYSGQESGAVGVDVGASHVLNIGVNMGLVFHRRTAYTERSLLTSSSESPLVRTHPVFLRYYKMKPRRFRGKKLEANAGPHSLPPRDGPYEEPPVPVLVNEANADSLYGVTEKAAQPVDALLEYILEACSDAERALACDEDVNSLFLGEDFPDNILESLRIKRPAIALDGRKVGSLALEGVVYRERAHKITTRSSLDLGPYDSANVKHPLCRATVLFRDSNGYDRSIEWPHQELGLSKKAQQQGFLTAMTISPDGKLVVAAYDDATLIVWELHQGTYTKFESSHEDAIQLLVFSPNGTEIASGSADTRIIVRTIIADGDGRMSIDEGSIHYLEGHRTDVITLVYSPDGSRLLSGSSDGTLKIWDATKGYTELQNMNNTTRPHWVSFTPDSKKIVTTIAEVAKVLDCTDGRVLTVMRGHNAFIYKADISHDGTRLATASEDETARVWDLANGEELLTLHEHSAPVWCVAFSPDDDDVVTSSEDGTIVIANSWDGQRRAVITGHGGSVDNISYSKSGRWICAGTVESNVGLLDARSGEFVAKYKGPEDKLKIIAFSADEDSIVSSFEDGTVHIFSITDVLRLR